MSDQEFQANQENVETKELDVVDIPDIDLPTEEKSKEISDTFDSALKLCFFGVGHAGSRITKTFWDMGYRRIAICNSAISDLASIDLPEEHKLSIGVKGAGQDPYIGRKAAEEHAEDVLDIAERKFGSTFDRALVVLGSGGGTGNGACEVVIKKIKELAQSLKIENDKPKVGVIVALPKDSEGQKAAANSYMLMEKLFRLAETSQISPLIIIDNQSVSKLYPGLPINVFWEKANRSICSILHTINIISCRTSRYTVHDTADFEDILSNGIMTFGVSAVKDALVEKTNISSGVRNCLTKNILCQGMDLGTGQVASVIFVGPQAIMENLPMQDLDYSVQTITRLMGDKVVLHQGLYTGSNSALVVYTAVSGLAPPDERMNELAKIGRLKDHNLG